MSNLKFYEAVLRGELPISKEWADKGWPPLLYPWFLSYLQLPGSDKPAKRAFMLAVRDSILAGELPAVRQRVAWFPEDDINEPHVNGKDFAAWLKAQGMEPMPLAFEWIHAHTTTAAAPEEKPVHPRERNTLLRLVIGMAIYGYGYNPQSKKNTAVKEITSDLARAGLDVSEQTVRNYLNEASNTVLPANSRQS